MNELTVGKYVQRMLKEGHNLRSIEIWASSLPQLEGISQQQLINSYNAYMRSIGKVPERLEIIGEDSSSINASNIPEIAQKNKWQGSGSKEDPFVVKCVDAFPLKPKTFINNRHEHIYFKNCQFKNITLKLKQCSNFTFDFCNISNQISLFECHDIIIKNSTILDLEMNRCYSNLIECCEIAKIKGEFNRNNKFIDNHIPHLILKEFIKTSDSAPSKAISKSFIFNILFFLMLVAALFFLFEDIEVGSVFLLLIIVPIVIVLFYIFIFRATRGNPQITKIIAQLPPNVYKQPKE